MQVFCAFTKFQNIIHPGENTMLVWQMLCGWRQEEERFRLRQENQVNLRISLATKKKNQFLRYHEASTLESVEWQ